MISIPFSLKKDELFLNFFSNCNLSIRCSTHFAVSVLSLSSVATISSIESGIVPRIVVLERYTSFIYPDIVLTKHSVFLTDCYGICLVGSA